MALFKVFRGESSSLPSQTTDGYAYFTTDDGKFYIDSMNSGDTIASRTCINPEMQGATSSAAGSEGMVPAPSAGDEGKFLKADGTWANIEASMVTDAFEFKGTIGTGGTVTSLPTTYKKGSVYKVITAGTYAGQACEVGDLIIALVNREGSGNQNSDWTVAQNNIDGAVTGPASSTTNNFAAFSDANGKTIKDSGKKASDFATSTHSHGNITNGGDITTTATIASGDRLVINDESASKVTNSSITFGNDTTTYLRNDGTWGTPPDTDTNTDTVYLTKPSLGVGLTTGTDPTYTVTKDGDTHTISYGSAKVKLNSQSSLGTVGVTSKLYSVGVDSNGSLAVQVPWENTTYSSLSPSSGSSSVSLVTRGQKYTWGQKQDAISDLSYSNNTYSGGLADEKLLLSSTITKWDSILNPSYSV